MKTAWSIFGHDVKALIRNPIAIALVLAVIVLSTALACYSVASTWSPYSHINELKVAVVNEDVGATLSDVQAKPLPKGLDAAALVDGIGSPGVEVAASNSSNASENVPAPEGEAESTSGQPPQNAEQAGEATGQPAGANSENPESSTDVPASEASSTAVVTAPDISGGSKAPGASVDPSSQKRMNVGAAITEALKSDESISWQFVTADEARAALASGEYYAEILLPEGFTADVLNVLSGQIDKPTIEYWVSGDFGLMTMGVDNVAPGSVDSHVVGAFSAVASNALAVPLKNVAGGLFSQGVVRQSTQNTGLDGAEQDLKTVSEGLDRTKAAIAQWRTAVEGAKSALDGLKNTAPKLRSALKDGDKLLADVRTTSHEVTSAYGSALAKGDQGLTDVLGSASDRVGSVTTTISDAQKELDGEISKAEKALEECNKLIAALIKADPKSSTLSDLKKQSEKLQDEISNLKKTSKSLNDAADKARNVGDDLSKDAEKALKDLKSRADTFNEVTLPELDSSLDALAMVMGGLEGVLEGLDAQVVQTKALLDNLADVMQKTEDATALAYDEIKTTAGALATARADVAALANAKAVQEAASDSGSSQSRGAFALSPIEAESQLAYAPVSYGSGMAPFFIGVALWVGCFMFSLLFKPEVDPTVFPRRRAWQAYVGRLMTLSLWAALLGLVMTACCLLVGVQASSPVALIVAGLVVALCLMSVVYALVKTFKHLGRALVVVLLLVQVPGVMGVYPAQMMPEFYQALLPWLPLTYGVGAFREAISGFYGLAYAHDLLWLVACALATLAIALFVRPRLLNLTRMLNRKLERADFFVTDSQGLEAYEGERSPLARVVQRLLEDEEERMLLHQRSQKYAQRYVVMQYVAPLATIILVAALVVVSFALPLGGSEMLLALGVFVAALVIVFALCIVFEYAYDNMNIQLETADASKRGVSAGGAMTMPLIVDARVNRDEDSEADESPALFINPIQDDWDASKGWVDNSRFNWDVPDEEAFDDDVSDGEAPDDDVAANEVLDDSVDDSEMPDDDMADDGASDDDANDGEETGNSEVVNDSTRVGSDADGVDGAEGTDSDEDAEEGADA